MLNNQNNYYLALWLLWLKSIKAGKTAFYFEHFLEQNYKIEFSVYLMSDIVLKKVV